MSPETVQRLVLATEFESIQLRGLTGQDAKPFFDLVRRNRVFLTRYGDYEDLVKATVEEIGKEFSSKSDAFRMGIWRKDELMGRLDIYEAAPGAWVLGFWLGEVYTGRGYMTAACRALMDHVRRARTVKEYWAGIRPINKESIALVERLGFSVFQELPDHTRFRLVCD